MTLAKIEDDEIVIRIPRTALSTAFDVLMARELVAERPIYRIVDLVAFSKEFVMVLNEENESGDTILHVAFDKAMEKAIEKGGEGIEP